MKSYGFAIIGTGMIAKFHARAVKDIVGARLVAVCSRERQRAEAFAAEFGCAAYTELERVLALPEVDIVVVATPSGAHHDPVIAAAKAGKHVLCEKPLETKLERIDSMIAAHREAGTQLGCTFQMRYMSALQPIRAALATGRFGTLTHAAVYVPWWRANEYYYGSSWHGTQALDGGGALMNQGIHMVDLLCDLMPPVRSVTGMVATVGHPGIEVEDVASASLRFAGGALGTIYGSTSQWPGYAKRLEICGTGGSVVLVDDRLEVFEFAEQQEGDAEVVAPPCEKQIGANNPAAMSHALHTACFSDFIAAVADGRAFEIDGASARRSVEVILAVYKSSKSGCRVEL